MSSLRSPADDLDRDQRLMARARSGDREAFEAIYEHYAPRVMHFLHGLCRDRDVAADLTQETFLRAWATAPRWRGTGRVSTWLFQIGKRLWWKRHRRRRMRPVREIEAARRGPARSAPPPSRGAEQDEEVRRLDAALLALSPRLRLVFVLVRIAHLTYAEAAEAAGLRLGTVKSRMAAAEAFLRRRLAEREPDRRST